jgi:hypothetical protein
MTISASPHKVQDKMSSGCSPTPAVDQSKLTRTDYPHQVHRMRLVE